MCMTNRIYISIITSAEISLPSPGKRLVNPRSRLFRDDKMTLNQNEADELFKSYESVSLEITEWLNALPVPRLPVIKGYIKYLKSISNKADSEYRQERACVDFQIKQAELLRDTMVRAIALHDQISTHNAEYKKDKGE